MIVKEELKKLESLLYLPIENINFTDDQVNIQLKGMHSEVGLKFLNENGILSYPINNDFAKRIDWIQIVENHQAEIRQAIDSNFSLGNYKITPGDLHRIVTLNTNDEQIFSFLCQYQGKWILEIDTQAEIVNMKNELAKSKYLVTQNKNSEIDHQNQLLDKAIDVCAKLYEVYINKKATLDKQEIKLITEFEKQELEVVDKLDKRDKFFKGIILIVCIAGLIATAILEVATSVAPILGVIIGLILKNNAISEYFSGSTKRKNIHNNFVEED